MFLLIVSGYERDSEPVILAEKMTRLLSEAEPPAKTAQDQEVCGHCFAFLRKIFHSIYVICQWNNAGLMRFN